MKELFRICIFKLLWACVFSVLLWFSVFIIGKSTWGQLSNWYAAKNWVEVQATISTLNLKKQTSTESRPDGGSYKQTLYKVFARYQYEVNGQTIGNNRISFAETQDNDVAGYNNKIFRRLDKIKSNGGTVSIWYDQNKPSNSVVDRSLRIESIALKFVFMFLTGGIGLIGFYFLVQSLARGKSEEESSGAGAFGYSILIIITSFCLMSVMFAITAIQTGEYAGLAALVFPALFIPIIIEYRRHSRRKEQEKSQLKQDREKQLDRIKGRPLSSPAFIYLGIFILLITLPIAWNEFDSFTHYTKISYAIFALPLLGIWLLTTWGLKAVSYSKVGELYLTTTPAQPIVGKLTQGKISGINLTEPASSHLNLICNVTEKMLGGSSSLKVLDQTIDILLEEYTIPKYFEFEFQLPNSMQKSDGQDVELYMRLYLKVRFGIKLVYIFEEIETM